MGGTIVWVDAVPDGFDDFPLKRAERRSVGEGGAGGVEEVGRSRGEGAVARAREEEEGRS